MEVKLFIHGQFVNSSLNKTLPSIDPSSGEIVAKYHVPGHLDIDRAVQSAKLALHSPQWKTMPQEKRAELLLKISELIKERANELIAIEVKDSGSTLRKAKADVFNTATYFKLMSKMAADLKLLRFDESASRAGMSKNSRLYSPVGVCAQIIPWNFPLVMAGWKIAPVIATGCTSVLKTASETPCSAQILAEIIKSAGVPDGVINIITGDAEVGRTLLNHPLINKIAFTGSTRAGKEILSNAAHHITNCTMELGGKSPNVIFKDADLNLAVDGALYAFLYHSGQACDSGTRILVEESVAPEFKEKLLQRLKDIKLKPTSDPEAGMGPLVSEKQMKTVLSYIEKSKAEGAKLLYGGKRLSDSPLMNGYFIEPTVFEITPEHTIFHEEIFGPVAGITTFKTEEEALKLANHSSYGLAAGIWTRNMDLAYKMARELEAGTVWINEYHLLSPLMPFGGLKESGQGRELGSEGLMSYLEVKHIWESECLTREKKVWFDSLF